MKERVILIFINSDFYKEGICNQGHNILLICGALRNLEPCAQFKKPEKHPWRNVTFSSKVAG